MGFQPKASGRNLKKAIKEVKSDPSTIPIWREIISKYHPTFIGDCEKAIEWSQSIVTKWLTTGMFNGNAKGRTNRKQNCICYI